MNFKNVVIFGDSYSTFSGVVPEGFRVYYTGSRSEAPDLKDASELWWQRLMADTDSRVLQNNSYSGSTVCNMGRSGDCSETTSFIARINKLANDGFFRENEINTVFVFGGTNDSWIKVPVGELQYENFQKEDLLNVLPGVCFFFKRVREEMPNARMIVIINTGLNDEIAAGMKNAAAHYGADVVELCNIEKISGHPTAKGMEQIKDQILDQLA
ncbi:MAG: hypothetical protein E7677_03405 [Ruminococcaceae bacterium]|nr:hypothetical protein [Oscillospiraceae bacterium]